jgi:hypothetical protein
LKYVTQRRRLGREHQRDEQFALIFEPGVEGLVDCRGDGLEAGQGCGVRARHRFDGIARELEVRLGVRHVQLHVAYSFEAALFRNHPARKAQRVLLQIALAEGIEQRRVPQFLGRDCRAGHDHVERGLDAEQSRQPLSAAGAGQ